MPGNIPVVIAGGSHSSGWYGPPRGTHGKGSQSGPGRTMPASYLDKLKRSSSKSSMTEKELATMRIAKREGLPGAIGSGQSYLVEFEDGRKGIMKNMYDEMTGHDGQAEVDAGGLAKLLGIANVPTVTTREEGGKKWTMHEFIEELSIKTDTEGNQQDIARDKANRNALIGIAVFDFLINNGDRFEGNIGFDANGKVWAIDHGMAQFTDAGRSFNPLHAIGNLIGEGQTSIDIPAPIMAKLKAVTYPQVQSAVSMGARHVWNNIQTLVQSGKLSWQSPDEGWTPPESYDPQFSDWMDYWK